MVQSDYRIANYDANNCQLRIPASGSHVDMRWQLQALWTRSVREAARSAASELGYPDLKPVQLKVVETLSVD